MIRIAETWFAERLKLRKGVVFKVIEGVYYINGEIILLFYTCCYIVTATVAPVVLESSGTQNMG
jgi:hypothetical protein